MQLCPNPTTTSFGRCLHQRKDTLLWKQGCLPILEDLTFILEKCRKEKNMEQVLHVYVFICANGLDAYPSLSNHIMSVLVDFGSVCHAQKIFETLTFRDEWSWSFLISGYIKQGELNHAFTMYEKMQEDKRMQLHGQTYASLVKACTKLKDLDRGREIHAEVAKEGLLESNVFIGSALVDMYAKCGVLVKAQEVFDKLVVRDAVLCNALMAGYVDHSLNEEAHDCFEKMQDEGISPDIVTFACILRACSGLEAVGKGQEVHCEIVKRGLQGETVVVNTLVDMYAKCGLLAEALDVFDMILIKDVVAWTSLVAGYVDLEQGSDALGCFQQMQQEGVCSDPVIYVFALKACGAMLATSKGKEIHAKIAESTWFQSDVFIGSTLLDMYIKCGCLGKAQEVFDNIPVHDRDVILWNSLVGGYAELGHGEEVLHCYDTMQHMGLSPDATTILCCLKACARMKASTKALEKHADAIKIGFESEHLVGNTLVDMYAKCGLLTEARVVFERLIIRTAVSWTSLIAGYVKKEQAEVAMDCLALMEEEGFSLVGVTYLCGLKACGSISSTIKGQQMHMEVAKKGLEKGPLIGNTIVDMYTKCGLLAEAQVVFERLPMRTVVSWTAMIVGYSQLGEGERVISLLEEMVREDIAPNFVTFVSVLSVCSHAGLLSTGQMLFEAITRDYGPTTTIDHYICVIDLLGRSGHIDKAVLMIHRMPYQPAIVMWHIVLGACQKWGDVVLGKYAFELAMGVDEKDPSIYVCMSNIYADAAMQDEANKIKEMQVKRYAIEKSYKTLWMHDAESMDLILHTDEEDD